MDYATVKADLRGILGRDVSALSVRMANSELSRSLRIIAMEKTVELTTAGGALTTPDDFEAVRVIKRQGVTLSAITSQATVPIGGAPMFYAIENGFVPISPAPDDGDTYSVTYYASVADLTDDADTNAAIVGAYEAFIFAVLYQHARLIRDVESAAAWGADALRTINQANMRAANDRMSGTLEHYGRTLG